MTEPLFEHIEDPVDEERLERVWRKVDARRDEYRSSSSRRKIAYYVSGFAVAAGVALGWFFGGPLPVGGHGGDPVAQVAPLFEAGAALRTASEEMSVGLADGSKVTLAPRSRVALQDTESEDVALNLEEGRVACQVAKDKGRVFSVLAGEVTIRVVGTTFAVERTDFATEEKVTVDVSEGVVEVKGPDGVIKRLGAGESWSVRIAKEDVRAAAPMDEGEATAVAEPAVGASKVKAKVVQGGPQAPEERDLFAEAREKRNAGDAAGAARLYQAFLDTKSSDPRSGVAALELGRLRMDQLGDAAGAIAPLMRAASGVGGGLGDDALARLVQAHAQLGQSGACKSTRARYLKTYPNGVHVERVRATCP